MRHTILVLTTVILLLSCNQNDTKQKELELKEREIALREKELALKLKDSTDSNNPTQTIAKKDTVQENKPLPADTKMLTLISPTYEVGDLAHLTFKDYTTHKEEEYECDWNLPAIQEIMKKCENHDGCPALKKQAYSATLKLKLLDKEEYDIESGGMKPTGKKEKRWVIVALNKITTP